MTTRQLDALGVALSLIQRVKEPEDRLAALSAVRAEIDDHAGRVRDQMRSTMTELRHRGRTWHEIGRILQVTPQRAQQFAAQPTTGEPNASQAH